jgi:hypothetical protein
VRFHDLSSVSFVPKQEINIKYCVKIGKSASETSALLTLAYGECTMKKLSLFEWHGQFKEGQNI